MPEGIDGLFDESQKGEQVTQSVEGTYMNKVFKIIHCLKRIRIILCESKDKLYAEVCL